MQWRNDREKAVGVGLGFIVTGSGRDARVVNLVFDEKDENHNSPRQGRVRPASMAEVSMWQVLVGNKAL
ncbi:hypothetical protein SEA_ROONEY_38 [Streptomyces phage Rooney]|jgi:hypothetical protein|nr:hypothetical protein SEA_GIBSON_38 [Streptomyces phage Gibson]QYW07295.1 hypothetical protein SEA_ROONEY_38 [Streptomyces phage Rooney]